MINLEHRILEHRNEPPERNSLDLITWCSKNFVTLKYIARLSLIGEYNWLIIVADQILVIFSNHIKLESLLTIS